MPPIHHDENDVDWQDENRTTARINARWSLHDDDGDVRTSRDQHRRPRRRHRRARQDQRLNEVNFRYPYADDVRDAVGVAVPAVEDDDGCRGSMFHSNSDEDIHQTTMKQEDLHWSEERETRSTIAVKSKAHARRDADAAAAAVRPSDRCSVAGPEHKTIRRRSDDMCRLKVNKDSVDDQWAPPSLESVEGNNCSSNRVRTSSRDDADRVSEDVAIDVNDDENDVVHDDRNNHRNSDSSTNYFPRSSTSLGHRRHSSKEDNRWNCRYCSLSEYSQMLHRVQLRRADWPNRRFLIGMSIVEHHRRLCSSQLERSMGRRRRRTAAVEDAESVLGRLSSNELREVVWVLRWYPAIYPPDHDVVVVVSHQERSLTNHYFRWSSRRDWWSTKTICPFLRFERVWIDCVTRGYAEWSSTKRRIPACLETEDEAKQIFVTFQPALLVRSTLFRKNGTYLIIQS